MATKQKANKAVPGAPPNGVKCHICPRQAAASVTFQSPTAVMKSLWLCRQCFTLSWAQLTRRQED